MHAKIKELQEKYKKGEIKKGAYIAALEKLVEDKTITQDEMDDAAEYDPEADQPIYTQADVDGMITRKATQLLRKGLKDAGVEIDADNKGLLGKVVELVKVGTGKIKPPEGQDAEAIKATAAKVGTLTADVKTLRLENALLKSVGKYNPASQTAVIAVLKSDYAHLIDFTDEEAGVVDQKSVDRAVRKLQLDEPTLFKADDSNGGSNKGGEGTNFRGKGPGGTGSAGDGDKNHDANKARAMDMLNLKKPEETTK